MKEYSYSGECEPTICTCDTIHPWTYKLEKTSAGEEGCYVCIKNCEFCPVRAFEVFTCDGFTLCASCKEEWLAGPKEEETVIMELAA